jgi:hypothetical protein
MKKVMIIIGAIILASIVLTGCGGKSHSNSNNDSSAAEITVGSNTVGDWYHSISRNMGGYDITASTKLTIIRTDNGAFEYKLATEVIDQMYGGNPKTEYSHGKLEQNAIDKKWAFSSGDFGDRGGYIEVPMDNWNDYEPTSLTVSFAAGRGNSMIFTKNEPNNTSNHSGSSRKVNMTHRCGRTWNGERDRTYGIYGDYCCELCYVDFYPN